MAKFMAALSALHWLYSPEFRQSHLRLSTVTETESAEIPLSIPEVLSSTFYSQNKITRAGEETEVWDINMHKFVLRSVIIDLVNNKVESLRWFIVTPRAYTRGTSNHVVWCQNLEDYLLSLKRKTFSRRFLPETRILTENKNFIGI